MTAPMTWQEVPPTAKRDDLNGREGGKHYLASNAAVACYETGRKVVRKSVVCVACRNRWAVAK
jgi:hypothetical protein